MWWRPGTASGLQEQERRCPGSLGELVVLSISCFLSSPMWQWSRSAQRGPWFNKEQSPTAKALWHFSPMHSVPCPLPTILPSRQNRDDHWASGKLGEHWGHKTLSTSTLATRALSVIRTRSSGPIQQAPCSPAWKAATSLGGEATSTGSLASKREKKKKKNNDSV